MNLSVSDITKRQAVERWYTAAPGVGGKVSKDNKTDPPLLRVKARYQKVDVLPMVLYQPLVLVSVWKRHTKCSRI